MRKTLVRGLVLALLLIATARFCHRETAGFRVAKVRSNLYDNGPFALPPLSAPDELLVTALCKQKFTYLGRGLQSFTFASEDGKWVLKLFANEHQQKIKWLKYLPLPIFLERWRAEQIGKERRKINKAFHSYRLAYEELREETGLLYVHPCATSHLRKQVTIIDRLKIAHQIDLDSTAFLLQRRVEMAYPYFSRLLASGNEEEVRSAIRSLLRLLLLRCQKGIADNDPLIRTNFGFIDAKPFEIDVGPFSKDLSIRHPDHYRPEIIRIIASLKNWMGQHRPSLVPYIDEELCALFAGFSSP